MIDQRISGVCGGCIYRRESTQAPCGHGLLSEEIAWFLMVKGFERKKALSKLKEWLELEFDQESSSWKVVHCKVREESR